MVKTLFRVLHPLFLVTLAVVLLTTAVPAGAIEDSAEALAEKVRLSNAECLKCHTADGLAALAAAPASDGPQFDHKAVQPFLVAPDAFHGSVHGAMECSVCHGPTSVGYPHPPTLKDQVSPCEECHASKSLRIEMQFEESVHAPDKIAGFTCTTCHDPHTLMSAKVAPGIRALVDQDNAMCLSCHGPEGATRFASFAKPDAKPGDLPKTAHTDLDRIHDWLPSKEAHWAKVRCIDCHAPIAKNLSHEIVDAEKAEKNCVACHSATTMLRDRLYRHLVKEEREQAGFLNSIIINDAYVIGSTRNQWLDQAIGWLLGLTLLGVLGHALARVAGWAIRRSGKGDKS